MLENNRQFCSGDERHYRFVFARLVFGGLCESKTLGALQKNAESHQEVRAECEQREKIITRGAIRMAYACNTEMKLTRHLGVHMAERRENHPVTLHSRAKCLKNTVLLLKRCTDTRLEPRTLPRVCEENL